MGIGTVDANGSRQFTTGIAGVNDNDIVIQTEDVSIFNTHMLFSTAGAMDVEVSFDGTNYSSAALSLADLGAASTNPVLVTVAGRVYGFRGTYRKIRVRQNGATAVANAILTSSYSK